VGAIRKATGRGVYPWGASEVGWRRGKESRCDDVLLKRRRVRQGRGGVSGRAHLKEG
jgi:hypothetical protein